MLKSFSLPLLDAYSPPELNLNSDFNSQITTDVNVVYRELTPTNYEINVTNATAPFALLFKQNYNVGWELAYNNKILNTHFEGDEYANAWLVNKTGNYTLHLFFAPQKIVSMINHISIFINVILLILNVYVELDC